MAAEQSTASLLQPIFEKILIKDVPQCKHGKVFVLRSDMSIREAIQALHERGILSAPVQNVALPETTTDWKTKYLGTVDMVKLVVVMLNAMEDPGSIPEEDESVETPEKIDATARRALKFHRLPSTFSERPLSEMTEAEAGWFPFLPIEQDATLLDAIVLMGTCKLKRLPVVDGPSGDLTNIITQSSIVSLLNEHIDQYMVVAGKTLEELGMAEPKPVHCIRASQSVKDAFTLIRDHNVSAVPVLGVNGEMVGNISARHGYFVVTAQNKMRVLSMKASAFLAWTSDQEDTWNIRSTAITCKPSDTLKTVIGKLAAARIHRIYLCDQHQRPFRVIALCDVLAKFADQPESQTCTLL